MKVTRYSVAITLIVMLVVVALVDRPAPLTATSTALDVWWAPSSPVTLYFATDDAGGLVAESRWIPNVARWEEAAVIALMEGPRDPDKHPVIPLSSRLIDIDRQNHTVVVNFDDAFVASHGGGTAGELLTVYAIVNTLTELPGVTDVRFHVNGEPLSTLAGHLDLTGSIQRDESLIVPSPPF